MDSNQENPTRPSGTGSVADELKGDAQKLKDTAAKQGEAKVEHQKHKVGEVVKSASSAIEAAADELRQDNAAPDWLASAFAGAAREIQTIADGLENKAPGELASATRRIARENPIAFLAASAAGGFALARFLRAGAEYEGDSNPGSTGNDTSRYQPATSGMGNMAGSYSSAAGQTSSTGQGVQSPVGMTPAGSSSGSQGGV